MSEELKPCPFCGGEAKFETYGGTACAVVCQACRCGTPTVRLDDGMAAVELWNRRERVVRCRDCKHGDPFCDSSSYPGMIDCRHFAQWDYYDDEPGVCPVEPDGFCAWGERRGER